MSWQYAKLEPFGLPVLLVLAVTNLLDAVLSPLLVVSESLIHSFVFI